MKRAWLNRHNRHQWTATRRRWPPRDRVSVDGCVMPLAKTAEIAVLSWIALQRVADKKS
jgi:hypothetical protein